MVEPPPTGGSTVMRRHCNTTRTEQLYTLVQQYEAKPLVMFAFRFQDGFDPNTVLREQHQQIRGESHSPIMISRTPTILRLTLQWILILVDTVWIPVETRWVRLCVKSFSRLRCMKPSTTINTYDFSLPSCLFCLWQVTWGNDAIQISVRNSWIRLLQWRKWHVLSRIGEDAAYLSTKAYQVKMKRKRIATTVGAAGGNR